MSLEMWRSEVGDARNILAMLDTVKSLRGDTSLSVLNKCTGVVSCVKGLPFACAVLTFVEGLFPDAKYNEIMNKLDDIEQSIQRVREDINCLGRKISWQGVMGRYFEAEIIIKQSTVLVNAIGKATRDDKGTETERFVHFVEDGKLQIAVNKLVAGVCGKSYFGGDILNDLYDQTRGHKVAIMRFAAQLIELTLNGIIALLHYEMVKANRKGKDVLKTSNSAVRQLSEEIKPLQESINRVLRKCDTEIKSNMQRDLEMIFDEDRHRSNEEICASMLDKMEGKYGHCRLFVVVYNDIHGFSNHCFNGCRVEVLHRHNKCVIVFYRDSSFVEGRLTRARVQSAADRIEAMYHRNAKGAYDAMENELAIGNLWGLAVFKRNINLRNSRSIATNDNVVWKIGYYFTFCVLWK